MEYKFTLSAIIAVPLLFALSAQAQEKDPKTQLPAIVQKTVDDQSKGTTFLGYSSEVEDGKLEYEVDMTLNGHARDVSHRLSGLKPWAILFSSSTTRTRVNGAGCHFRMLSSSRTQIPWFSTSQPFPARLPGLTAMGRLVES